jgi:hypothetical protein
MDDAGTRESGFQPWRSRFVQQKNGEARTLESDHEPQKHGSSNKSGLQSKIDLVLK